MADEVKKRIESDEIMRENHLRLIELAYDYVSAETEPQATQAYDQATLLATEKTTFRVWLDLIDYMEGWNRNSTHKEPMGRASALQFFSTRQAELTPPQQEPHEQSKN